MTSKARVDRYINTWVRFAKNNLVDSFYNRPKYRGKINLDLFWEWALSEFIEGIPPVTADEVFAWAIREDEFTEALLDFYDRVKKGAYFDEWPQDALAHIILGQAALGRLAKEGYYIWEDK